MALPKVLHPTKKIKVPSLNIELEFEPFTTGDEKSIVLMDKNASLYEKSKIQLDVLKKCCKDNPEVLDSLSAIEITYMFLQLRKISVGGTLELMVKCSECDEEITVSVDIDLIEFNTKSLAPLKFNLDTEDGPYIVICTQFMIDDFKYLNAEEPSYDDAALVIRSMVRPDGNNAIELTHEEKLELFNQLDTNYALKIVEYIKDAPTLEKTLDLECANCGHKFKGELKDFFI